MYLDTCIEPWPGGYTDPSLSAARAPTMRCARRRWRCAPVIRARPTAVITHGANPGLVSHFVKQAMLNIAADTGVDAGKPAARAEWAALARRSASRSSTSPSATRRSPRGPSSPASSSTPGRSTASSARARSRPSWAGARTSGTSRATARATISAAARDLSQPARRRHAGADLDAARGALPRLLHHPQRGDLDRRLFLGAARSYRPTVHYAYHPCDAAVLSLHELAGRNYVQQERQRLLMDGIIVRHRRARRAARWAQEERLLVRLAALDRRGAQARSPQQRDEPASDAAVLAG